MNAQHRQRAILSGKRPKYSIPPRPIDTVEYALDNRDPRAKAVRFGAIGDPARADRAILEDALKKVRAEGLAVLGYTHFWRDSWNWPLCSEFLASCESMDEVDEANGLSFAASVVVPPDHPKISFTPAYGKVIVCPAQWRSTSCNECRLCDPMHPAWTDSKISAIAFRDHSRKARKLKVVA